MIYDVEDMVIDALKARIARSTGAKRQQAERILARYLGLLAEYEKLNEEPFTSETEVLIDDILDKLASIEDAVI